MDELEYSIAYKEVIEILKYIPKEDYDKIPKEKIKLFELKANKNHHFVYNSNLTLDEQNVSKRGKAIIAILFRDYWATDMQREKILARQAYERQKIEEQKNIKYNPDNIFKNKIKSEFEINNILPTEIRKENLFNKFVSYLKNFFKKISGNN